MDTIVSLLKNFAGATGIELYIKLALLLLAGIGSIWYIINKAKLRKKKAGKERDRDRQQDIDDNVEVEDQNSKDGTSVRDRLRGKKNG